MSAAVIAADHGRETFASRGGPRFHLASHFRFRRRE